jgi:hypothetical protein
MVDEYKVKDKDAKDKVFFTQVYTMIAAEAVKTNPQYENPSTGHRTVSSRVNELIALHDKTYFDIEPPTVTVEAETEKGRSIPARIVGAPAVVFKTLGDTLKGGLHKIGEALHVVDEKPKEEAKEEA